MNTDRRTALLAEYTEINTNLRLLTEIRFKLLALLPIVVAFGIAAARFGQEAGASPALEGGVFFFGLLVTAALATYNARNDQIYVYLIARAAAIERELGLLDGSFFRRPNAWREAWFGFGRWHIGHSNSVAAVYGGATALWLAGIFITIIQVVWGTGDAPVWIYAIAVAAAILVTICGGIELRRQRKRQESRCIESTEKAIEMATEMRSARSALECRNRPSYVEFVEVCAELFGREHNRTWRKDQVRERILHFAEMPNDERALYGLGEIERANVYYVGSIVDLPPAMLTQQWRRR